MNTRQRIQLAFEQGSENIIIGSNDDCPIHPDELAKTTEKSPYVIQTFNSGLTAEVYRIRLSGKDYTLKKRRSEIKVRKIDGQLSFLNEVLCRQTLNKYKTNPTTSDEFLSIAFTVYANYRLGIILSEWIEGMHHNQLNSTVLNNLFATLVSCEKIGLFERDLSAGNLLIDSNLNLTLFDFGYMYSFDPLTELNDQGLDAPMVNFCERFETRFFSRLILLDNYARDQSIALFRKIKKAALFALERKLDWLLSNKANQKVISHVQSMIHLYQHALCNRDFLDKIFTCEMFRSHVLDIEEDISGQSCNPITIRRIEEVISMIEHSYFLLKEHGALFGYNKGKSKEFLINSYREKLHHAHSYQLN
ncbi:phosphotransferase [Vibrio paucivorans]|uniref:Phosphotransferase n=1 Tax=Vibrio paucivorans TaxID=2829489 RepID=A0A9X3HSK5_9VIBR|nr:phosphotransferase [Vibrio paucivorans]MCW8334903.1 phosphotransferase [Vibrio paucivorans]